VTLNAEPLLSIIGAGRVGSALAYHFLKSNLTITGIIEKNKSRHSFLKNFFPKIAINSSIDSEIISKSRIILISVQDDQLSGITKQICGLSIDFSQKVFVHTSGVYSSQILALLKKQGAQIASAHPIYSFVGNDLSKVSLSGVYFDVEGDMGAIQRLTSVFQRAGINPIEITADQKLAIHIASVFYSNYFVGLTQIAQEVLHRSKIPKENLWKPFQPLIQSTLQNLSSYPLHEALSGPIKRGDIHTIESHLKFLDTNFPEAKSIYCQIANSLIQLTSLSNDQKDKLIGILRKYNKNTPI
jgi:predicted short-subunit dehydrogenase-like oxidoreductase (DUF2520 family)